MSDQSEKNETNRPFFPAGVIGLVVVAMSIALMAVFPSRLPEMPEGFVTPVIAFEFVRTMDDVKLIFGPTDSPQRREIVKAMDRGNKLDYVYMILYAGFLACFSLTCARVTHRKLFYIPVCLAGFVLTADALENIQLLGITANLETMNITHFLVRLHWLTWAKWGGLSLIFLFLIPYFIKEGLYALFISAAAVICAILAAAAFMHRSALNEMFGGMTAIMFVLIIIYSFVHKLPERSIVKVDRVHEATPGLNA